MTIVRVRHLLVLCRRPHRLTAHEADRWLQSELRDLLADGMVADAQVTPLASASLAWPRDWDYLIQLDLRDGSDPDALVTGPTCASLLGDLRLLGMGPSVVVADDERTVALVRGRR